jgi:hypothetical protein
VNFAGFEGGSLLIDKSVQGAENTRTDVQRSFHLLLRKLWSTDGGSRNAPFAAGILLTISVYMPSLHPEGAKGPQIRQAGCINPVPSPFSATG